MILEFTTIMDMPNDSALSLNDSQHGNGSDHAHPPYWDLPTTIILSSLMIVFMVFALVGNFLVIIVVARHRGMRTRTNLFLCNLAIADFLCALLCMPVSLTTMIKGDWIFGSPTGWFCQFNGFLMPLFFVTSIHTLMYISVHKYISITRPFSRVITYRRILVMIAMAWLWAAITGYVTIHGLNRVLHKPYTTQCGPDYPHDLRTYLLPLHTTLTCYVIPFTIIITCYILMFREIRAHGVRLELHSNKEKQAIFIQQRRITFTLFMVLIVFILSWTPYILYSVYVSILKDKNKAPHVMNAVSYWFGYMNSACNPVIYALRSPAFRDGYMEILCRTRAVIVSEDLEPVHIMGHYIFLRSKTEPWVSSPGPFGKLKSYIKRNTLSHSQRSQDHSTDSQNGGFSSLLSGRHKTLSTNSLPEALKNRSHVNMSGAKVTKIGGNQVITIGGKIVYFKEAKHSRDRSKGDSTASDDQSSSGPRSIIKKPCAGDAGLRVSFHDTAVGAELTPVIEHESQSQESNNATNHVSPSLVAEPHMTATNHKTSEDSAVDTEDDSVFASVGADTPLPVSQFAPRIQITSENNDVFFVESEGEGETLDVKRSRDYTRSVSEQPTVVDDADVNTNANAVTRSTSDNFLNKSDLDPALRRAKVTKTNSFLRWFHRKKAGSPVKSESPPKVPNERHSCGFLSFPRMNHHRSYSDGEETDNPKSKSAFPDHDGLTKVKSDTVIYSDNNSNARKSWFFKLGNKPSKSDSHILEGGRERRKISATLQSYPSIERLDRIPSRRRRSKKRKRRVKRKPDISSNTEESWLELDESTVIDVDDVAYPISGLLNRSLSDPCICVHDLEEKVQFNEDIRRERSLRRSKKKSTNQSPDVQSVYLMLDNFESCRSSDV